MPTLRLYQDAGQIDKAVAWVEQGLDAFKDDKFTGQLGDFLIATYEQQNRFEEAMAIVWQDFSRQPSLHLYRKLKQQADKTHAWSQWRDQALTHIKQVSDKTPKSSQQRRLGQMGQIGYSLLVEIFLWEEEIEQAWQAAKSGGCSSRLWMQLADLRIDHHPEDALFVYQSAVEPLINQTDNAAYRQAVELIIKVKDIMTRLDRVADFETFVAQLSKTYRRKRNFIKFLRQAGIDNHLL